jgi:PIN domain nuclease of toxin-antitoxin system
VPSIILVELSYLVEKGRLPAAARRVLADSLDHEGDPYELAPLDRKVADALEQISRAEIADLPDRVIAATAFALGIPLVSRDRQIRASAIETIWQ